MQFIALLPLMRSTWGISHLSCDHSLCKKRIKAIRFIQVWQQFVTKVTNLVTQSI